MEIPAIVLSVRQPWAWAIVYAGKDIENRSRFAATKGNLGHFGRIAVHAAIGMTRDEYEDGRDFMASLGIDCPKPSALVRGGIIGAVTTTNLVRFSESPWFFGPCGLVLANPEACEPVPCKGALGLFRWVKPPEYDNHLAAPLPWMISWPERPNAKRSIAAGQTTLL